MSASTLLGTRASSCRASRMRRSTSSITAGRTFFVELGASNTDLDDRSTITPAYRMFFDNVATNPNVLQNEGSICDEGAIMRVGVPTEIKNNEYRVAITPAGVAELTRRGHDVVIQAGAGEGSEISDTDFKFAGAEVISGAEHVWEHADLLLKVKEPIEPEYALMHRGQTLFRSEERRVGKE